MAKLTLTNKNSTPTTKGVAKKLTPDTSPTPKGVAKRIPPKRPDRSHKKTADSFADRGVYVRPPPEPSARPLIYEAYRSFDATSSGDAYKPEARLDANGEIELRAGNTPSGLFSPAPGESWDMPYTPEHVSPENADLRSGETSPEADIITPGSRDLYNLFTPDAPRGSLSKKIVTEFVSDYGGNVPDSAREDNYTGSSITAVVVKTFTPCYIVQMPKKVRARMYSLILFPQGKDKAPRPFFSHLSNFRVDIPPLLQVCRQLRNEASRIYYGNLWVTGSSLQHLVPWLHTLDPPTRAMIGKIKLPFDAWNHVDKTKEQQVRLRLKEFRQADIEVKRPKFDVVVKPEDKTRSMGGDLTDDE